jgi:hypothetical protein
MGEESPKRGGGIMTDWQKIFIMSTVNGADNCQDMLPRNGWEYPRETWLQKRLEELKEERKEDKHD